VPKAIRLRDKERKRQRRIEKIKNNSGNKKVLKYIKL
jgi:hypothetical protein